MPWEVKVMKLLTLVGLLGRCGARALNGLGDGAGSVPAYNVSPVGLGRGRRAGERGRVEQRARPT